MKKLSYILFLFICVIPPITAQQNLQEDAKAQLENEKMLYLTEQIKLTPEQAAKFWPIYNAHKKELQKLRNAERAIYTKIEEAGTSANYETALTELQNIERQKSTLHQTYYVQYRTVLSAEQLFKYYQAERAYKRILLNKIK